VAKIKPYEWLSEIWGKCNRGETVFRRFRKTIVVEANPSPSYTRTEKQARIRDTYSYLRKKWHKLSEDEKKYYEELGRRFNLPAYQTFMKYNIPIYKVILGYYEITIDNSNNGNDLVDYQILLIINNDSEFFSTIENKTYIEVYDEDAKTLLPFWIEEWDEANCNARIWIKVPRIKANSVKRIFLIANKDRTEGLSNPEAVFDFYDDFLGDALDTSKWTPNYVNTVNYEVLNGELRIYDATKANGAYWIYNNTDSGSQIKANFSPLDNMIIEWKQKMEEQTVKENLGEVGLALVKSNNAVEVFNPMYDNQTATIVYGVGKYAIINGDRYDSNIDISPDTYYILKIVKNNNKYVLKVYDLEGNKILEYSGESANAIDYMAIAVGAYGERGFSPMRIDWVRVRKYTEPAPTVSYAKIA